MPELDPYANDPGHWGASLVTLAEFILPCLDTASARSVVEIGAYAGDLTRLLVDRAAATGGQVWAIDPAPRKPLVELAGQRRELELIQATSHDALRRIPSPDAVIVDGDHNYWTVSEELRLIEAQTSGGELPLLVLHDVGWPHGRRDDYFDPELVPAEHRHPTQEGGGLFPGDPGLRPGGLAYKWPAAREGGPRNGVLTAVEDFLAERENLRLAVVPAFFGLGFVWSRSATWADAISDVLEVWDRNPVLERLEANRTYHLASSHVQLVAAARAQERVGRQQAVLRRLLDSSAFTVAERLSRLRRGARIATWQSVVSKEEIRRALEEG